MYYSFFAAVFFRLRDDVGIVPYILKTSFNISYL